MLLVLQLFCLLFRHHFSNYMPWSLRICVTYLLMESVLMTLLWVRLHPWIVPSLGIQCYVVWCKICEHFWATYCLILQDMRFAQRVSKSLLDYMAPCPRKEYFYQDSLNNWNVLHVLWCSTANEQVTHSICLVLWNCVNWSVVATRTLD
jgi:hypothetical protein